MALQGGMGDVADNPSPQSSPMTDQDALLTAVLLTHRNQVALAESVQLISRWFQQNGLATVPQALQGHLEQVVNNSLQINRLLETLETAAQRAP